MGAAGAVRAAAPQHRRAVPPERTVVVPDQGAGSRIPRRLPGAARTPDVNDVVLITGGGGFAGSHLLEHLAGTADLVGWARSEPPPEVAHLARWTRLDMLNGAHVRQELQALRPAAVYHCAGHARVADSWHDTSRPLAGNVLTTHHLLDGLRRAGCASRVIIPGSATVYAGSDAPHREDSPTTPSSPYAVSKLAQEQLGLQAVLE